jgi:PhnB protein
MYTDVFVTPVPKAKADAYRDLAELGATVWREHGALSYVELEADDVKPGKLTSFPQSVHLEDGEEVVVAVITYRSRAHRDEVNAKVMKDPRFAAFETATVPFDPKRMFFGGFKPLVGAHAQTAGVVKHIQPYLFFRGRCEEAIGHYQRTLGAEIVTMMRFRDNPDTPSGHDVPAEMADRIMHATLRIGGVEIMMSDGMRSGPLDFACMSLSLSVATEADADRLFAALAADGTVAMPLGATFFSPRFGAVTDKYGVTWMVGVHP